LQGCVGKILTLRKDSFARESYRIAQKSQKTTKENPDWWVRRAVKGEYGRTAFWNVCTTDIGGHSTKKLGIDTIRGPSTSGRIRVLSFVFCVFRAMQ
jgi:hypothetical protein